MDSSPGEATGIQRADATRGASLLLVLVLTLGIAMRWMDLGTGELWTDEAFTALLTGHSLSEIGHITALDVHPPLYYFVVRLVRVLTGSATEWTLRVPSALASTLALLLLASWFRRRLSGGATLVATALLAFNPLQLFCAQEARMYPSALLGAAVLAHAYEAWRRAPTRGRLAVVILAEVVLLHLHYFTAFLCLGLGLHALRHPPEGATRQDWLLSQCLVGLGFLPWMGYALPTKLSSGYVGNEWRLPITLGESVPNVLGVGGVWLDGQYSFSGTHRLWWLPWSLLGVGLWRVQGERDPAWEEAMWVVLPPLAVCILLQPFTREIHWLARYLLVLTPWFAILVARSLEVLLEVASPVIRRTLLGAVLVLALSGGLGYSTGPRAHFYRRLLPALAQDDPGALLVSFSDGWVLAYYLQEPPGTPGRPWLLLEPGNIFSQEELGWTPERARQRNRLGGPLGADHQRALEMLTPPEAPDTLWVLMDKYTWDHSKVAKDFLAGLGRIRRGSRVKVHEGDDHTLLRYTRP